MKKYGKLFRSITALLMTFALCFSAGAAAFAAGIQSDEVPEVQQEIRVPEDQAEADATAPEASAEDDMTAPESSAEEGTTALESVAEPDTSPSESSGETDALPSESLQEPDTATPGASEEPDTAETALEALIAALDAGLREEFPGLTDEEIEEKLAAMSDDEVFALMEKLLSDPAIESLIEAIVSDEELTGELEEIMQNIFGEPDPSGITGDLKEAVKGMQGSTISWILTTDGTLTISGSGSILPDYEEFLGEELATYTWDDYIDYVTKIVIKDGITNVPVEAFLYASGLKTAVIPASVTSIESAAFAGCERLSAVYFTGDAPFIAEDAFEGCSEDLTLYYLEGTSGWDKLEGYKLALWKAASPEESSKETDSSKDDSKEETVAKTDETPKGTPDTGDRTSMYPFIILMAAAVLCGGVIVIRMRKKR